jgi:hypothetical protein
MRVEREQIPARIPVSHPSTSMIRSVERTYNAATGSARASMGTLDLLAAEHHALR